MYPARLILVALAFLLAIARAFAANYHPVAPEYIKVLVCQENETQQTSNITETILVTCTIGTDRLGTNGMLRIYAYWENTGTFFKTVRYRLDGTLALTWAQDAVSGASTVSQHDAWIAYNNSASVQNYQFITTQTSGDEWRVTNGTINIGNSGSLTVTCQISGNTPPNTCALRSLTVEAIYSP